MFLVNLIRNLAALVLLSININHALSSDQSDSDTEIDIKKSCPIASTKNKMSMGFDKEIMITFAGDKKLDESGEKFFNRFFKGLLSKEINYQDYLAFLIKAYNNDEITKEVLGKYIPFAEYKEKNQSKSNRTSRKRKRSMIESDETTTGQEENKQKKAADFQRTIEKLLTNNPNIKSYDEAAALLGCQTDYLYTTVSKLKLYMRNPKILDRINNKVQRINAKKERLQIVENMTKSGFSRDVIGEKLKRTPTDVDKDFSLLYEKGCLTSAQVEAVNPSKAQHRAGKKNETYNKVNNFLRKRITNNVPPASSMKELGETFNNLPQAERMHRKLNDKALIKDHLRKLKAKPHFPDKQALIDYIESSKDNGSTRFGGKNSNSGFTSHKLQDISRKNTLNTIRKVKKTIRSMPKQKKKLSARAKLNKIIKKKG